MDADERQTVFALPEFITTLEISFELEESGSLRKMSILCILYLDYAQLLHGSSLLTF